MKFVIDKENKIKQKSINNAFKIAKQSFLSSAKALIAMGYDIKVVSVPKNKPEYDELPFVFVEFATIAELPSIPNGYDLCHITDERYSLLVCKLPPVTSVDEMVKNILTASSNLSEYAR